MSTASQIFGLASVAAYIRNGGSIDSKYIIETMNISFGGNSGDGAYIYNLFKADTGLLYTNGFSVSSQTNYKNLEDAVSPFTNSDPSKIGTAAIVYGYSNNLNADQDTIVKYINTYNKNVSQTYNTSFISLSSATIDYFLSSFSLQGVNNDINSSPESAMSVKKGINYNWYDSSPLFTNFIDSPLQTLIKDVENQYYYLSGELLYPSLPSGLAPCISAQVSVNTPTGLTKISIFKKTPCIDQSTYVGPASGTKFFRVFNDGPGTSGYFDDSITSGYIGYDKNLLPRRDYYSNSDVVYTYDMGTGGYYYPLVSGAQSDIPGVFSSSAEYGVGKTNVILHDIDSHWSAPEEYIAHAPLMRMHQGDNLIKISVEKVCLGYDGPNCNLWGYVTGYHNWTGWKFAGLELDKYWSGHFANVGLNPKLDTSRLLKRVLNLNNNFIDNTIYSPYLNVIDTGDGTLTCCSIYNAPPGATVYVGPPQLNATSAIPGFVFYQTFANNNFSDKVQIVMRPAISRSNSASINSDSVRDFEISNFNIFSGTNAASFPLGSTGKKDLYISINSSGLVNYDDIFRKSLSIGDNFQNQVTFNLSAQSNAGYNYSGYNFFKSGVPISASDLLSSNIEKIGATYSQVNYIDGYKRLDNGLKYKMSNLKASIITGEILSGINYTGQEFDFRYFSSGVLGALNRYWESFCPVPSDVLNNLPNYSEIYASQPVENYLPRYASGPYATFNTTFLYPNAQLFFNKYNSVTSGFPYKVKYKLSIKEETVREVYITSGLNGDIKNHFVIRADTNNSPFNLGATMATPFVANNTLLKDRYDFNKNKTLYPNNGEFFNQAAMPHFVDANYVPNRDGCTQLNLNSSILGDGDINFNCGVRYTGRLLQRKIYTGVNKFKYVLASEPLTNGTFWGYKGREVSGEMVYCPPLFNLATLSLSPSDGLRQAIYSKILEVSSPTFSNDGLVRYGSLLNENYDYNGKDPIYCEYVGGRIGSGAELEGGTHSKGIIGDNLYDFNLENWGTAKFGNCVGYGNHTIRYPQNDKYFTFLSLNSGGLKINTRNLFYYPFYLNATYHPFTSSISNVGVTVTPVQTSVGGTSDFYFDFDLKDNFYPLRDAITSGFYSGLYYSGGFNIGPFDRDVEFCITGKHSIVPSGYLIIDGEQLTYDGLGGCPLNDIEGFYANSGIVLGQGNRNEKLTTFKLIPSGKSANVNISGYGKIGLPNKSIVTIRPRTIFGAVDYYSADTNLSIGGDRSIMDSFKYVNNGTESIFTFPSTSFNSLLGSTISLNTNPLTKIIFPIPDNDFDLILKPTIDSFGNKTYTQKSPTFSYWSQKYKSLGINAYFTGIREVTRIYLSIDKFETQYGEIPYQSIKTIIPSGECIVSGVFSYSGQAESAVITEGIVLSGWTGSGFCANSLKNIYEPLYVSDVLGRLPTGIATLPSGTTAHPIFPAPSLMKKRKNYFKITGGDAYVNVDSSTNLNYNKFIWPALSDLAILNPSVVYEQLPSDDGSVFTDSHLIFSACQGQIFSGAKNPTEDVTYQAITNYLFLDTLSTNALYNTGKCIFTPVVEEFLLHSGELTGIFTPDGTPLNLAVGFKTN